MIPSHRKTWNYIELAVLITPEGNYLRKYESLMREAPLYDSSISHRSLSPDRRLHLCAAWCKRGSNRPEARNEIKRPWKRGQGKRSLHTWWKRSCSKEKAQVLNEIRPRHRTLLVQRGRRFSPNLSIVESQQHNNKTTLAKYVGKKRNGSRDMQVTYRQTDLWNS